MRFVVDVGVALWIIENNVVVDPEHQLLAPASIRSQVLDTLYRSVQSGELSEEEGLRRNRAFGQLKMRLLGDAVLRRKAWAIADELGWASTTTAEYVALTQLQADAFVTLDEGLRTEVARLVRTASVDDLR